MKYRVKTQLVQRLVKGLHENPDFVKNIEQKRKNRVLKATVVAQKAQEYLATNRLIWRASQIREDVVRENNFKVTD